MTSRGGSRGTTPGGSRRSTQPAGGVGDRQAEPSIRLYTRSGCGYCISARTLLERRGISFTEISLDHDAGFRGTLRRTTGRSTVPQAVIHGRPVGGSTDLARLDRHGVLEPLAQGLPFPRAVVRRRLRPVGLLPRPLRRARSRWSFAAVVVDEQGTVISRQPAADEEHAVAIATRLTVEASGG